MAAWEWINGLCGDCRPRDLRPVKLDTLTAAKRGLGRALRRTTPQTHWTRPRFPMLRKNKPISHINYEVVKGAVRNSRTKRASRRFLLSCSNIGSGYSDWGQCYSCEYSRKYSGDFYWPLTDWRKHVVFMFIYIIHVWEILTAVSCKAKKN